jgi:hypothetical protein
VSRYVHVTVASISFDELCSALEALGIAYDRAEVGRPLLIRGGVECGAEPGEVRCAAGELGSVQEFGFRHDADTSELLLLCGELDRELLEARLLGPLRSRVLASRIARIGAAQEVEVASTLERDGLHRIVVRPR